MKLNKKRLGVIIILLFLLLLSGGIAWCLWIQFLWPLILLLPLWIYCFRKIILITEETKTLLLEFTEAVRYNDFSKNYNTASASENDRTILQGLNFINNRFKEINKERKAENIYLQTILETVGIGIISFNKDTGVINRMNEAFKKITDIPYFKNIKALEKRNPSFYQLLQQLQPGNTFVHDFKKGMLEEKLLVTAAVFSTNQQTDKLISLQNVKATLDATESLAWQKLLNVMTHEIMNSVAPISSLADTLIKQLQPDSPERTAPIDTEDLKLGLDTIKKRSEGLQRFAVTYRNLNKITRPVLKKIAVGEVFENLQSLMQPMLDQKNIQLDVILKDPFIAIQADISLVEQVLINLMTNAIEAVRDKAHPHIELSAEQEEGKTVIRVTDNGKGISNELKEQVFIPFFSTRKNGNGIGLSLCKQIMLLHKGSIQVNSIEGQGTVFLLYF